VNFKIAKKVSFILLTMTIGMKTNSAQADLGIIADLVGMAVMGHVDKVKNDRKMNLKNGYFSDPICIDPVGSIRIVEPTEGGWARYKLSAPTRVLQAAVNKSNCFTVVDRSAGFDAAQKERELAMAGQLKNGQSIGNSLMRGADFVLVPSLMLENSDAGGGSFGASGQSSGLANLMSAGGKLNVKTHKKTAEVVLTLMDVRTSEQIISIVGEAKISDKAFAVAGNAANAKGNVQANAGNWNNTEIGKVIKTAYEEAYKKMILDVGKRDLLAKYGKNDEEVIQKVAATAKPVATLVQTKVTVSNTNSVNSTDLHKAKTLVLKRATRLFKNADFQSEIVTQINEGMFVYPTGEANNNMIEVEDEKGNTGWLSSSLVQIK